MIHRCSAWRSLAVVELTTLEWVDLFNYLRLLQPLGKVPPIKTEAAIYNALDNKPIAA